MKRMLFCVLHHPVDAKPTWRTKKERLLGKELIRREKGRIAFS
jgi:hypothetical protein